MKQTKIKVSDARSASELFWPEFISIKGLIYLKSERSNKNVKFNNSNEKESFFNHTHILDHLIHKSERKSDPFYNSKHVDFQMAYAIGRKVCYMWAYKLLHDFPRSDFRIYLHGFDPIVRFHKIRKGIPNCFETKSFKKEIAKGEFMIVDTRKLRRSMSQKRTT